MNETRFKRPFFIALGVIFGLGLLYVWFGRPRPLQDDLELTKVVVRSFHEKSAIEGGRLANGFRMGLDDRRALMDILHKRGFKWTGVTTVGLWPSDYYTNRNRFFPFLPYQTVKVTTVPYACIRVDIEP